MLPKVIVSLTSYPERYEAAAQTLGPLFRQTVAPDRIQLWLDDDDVSSREDVPLCLRDLEQAGLEIRWCERNLKPHDKYFWTMQENSDDIVITIDDDIVYPLDLVQGLLHTHFLFPHAVVANRTHIVAAGEDDGIASYGVWEHEQLRICGVPRADLTATGAGGILYPPHVFDAEVFDESAIRETSLLADDLWLKVHELRLGVPVVWTGVNASLTYIPDTQQNALYHDNLNGGRNDQVLASLLDRYPCAKEALALAVTERGIQEAEEEDAISPGVARRVLHRITGR